MLKKNILKSKLLQGKPVIGTWNTLASPLVTEIFGQAGFDFQIIDLEHGPFVLDEIHLHVSACENSGECAPIVRVPSNEDWMVLQALDQGAHGIVVPHISSRDSAQKLVSIAKYHPEGERGFTPFSKAGGFNNKDVSRHVATSNAESLVIVIIESSEGLTNLEEILDTPGVDIVYFGAYDLSQALGYPGDVRHPEVVKAIKSGVELVSSKGRWAGGFVPQSKDDIKWLLDMGMKLITYEVDSSILHSHVSAITEWFKHDV